MKKWTTPLLFLILITGIALVLYPPVSNYWNSLHQSHLIDSYAEELDSMDSGRLQTLWDEAVAYNQGIRNREVPLVMTEAEKEAYGSTLCIDDSGIMGYIDIPQISVSLPIYHGVSNEVLQIAVGHVEWSAFPVGGEGTNCVLSGHRGLPSARLFTDLDQLREGDIFILHVLNQDLTYEIDQILIVLPQETQALMPEAGKDYCTLVTCTPYGVNSHRILVRGHRIENEAASVNRVTSDAIPIDEILVAPILGVAILLVVTPLGLAGESARKKRRPDKAEARRALGVERGRNLPEPEESQESEEEKPYLS